MSHATYAAPNAPSHASDQIKVWDPLVRLFHWSLVAAFATAYVIEEDPLAVHVWAGYTVLALVAVRLLWGFLGPKYARFSDFVYRPQAISRYLSDALRARAPRHIGHSPAGGAMVLALLLIMVAIGVTGLALYGVEEHAGPLASLMSDASESWEEGLEEVHEVLANLALALIILHVAGVVFTSLSHRENLVRAMVTGRKRSEAQ